ncbi:hypothetical protein EsDP_00007388 [Epichloe bromicola]|uniref:Uncharacterized protein n=1 Tax=Epichloe bromicola TaxID=79588 RepID=A0ABQ0D0F3_9HYPO
MADSGDSSGNKSDPTSGTDGGKGQSGVTIGEAQYVVGGTVAELNQLHSSGSIARTRRAKNKEPKGETKK